LNILPHLKSKSHNTTKMKKLRNILILVFIAVLQLGLNAAKTKKLLIIGIDGCRIDALMLSNATFIKGLLSTSTYSLDAQTSTPTMSCNGWSNMNTGVWGTKHNVMNTANDFSPNNYTQWPDFFTYLERSNPALVTASFCSWGPLNDNLFHSDTKITTTDLDANTTSNAIAFIQNNNPDAVLVDLGDVDHTGHSSGFGTTGNYITAINAADNRVRDIINAVKARPTYSQEDWLFIITTDHGGTGYGHGGGSSVERKVWVIMNGGAAIQNQALTNTSTVNYEVPKSIKLNGTNDYLRATTKSAFNFGSSQDFTVECKIKINSITGDPVVIGNKNWANGANKGFVIFVQGNMWRFNIGDGTNRQDVDGVEINDTKWHHIAISVDRDKNAVLYQDGEFIGAITVNNIGDISSGLELALGQDGTKTYGNFFNGSLSDVRIWNKALTGNVIKQWFNQDITAAHPDYPTMNAYWKLNEGSGTTIADSKGTNPLIFGGSAIQWNSQLNSVTPSFENAVKLVDVAVTALDHFGVYPESLDGKSLLPINTKLPLADISSDITSVYKTNYVAFNCTSVNYAPTQYAWTFSGGSPSTSNIQKPVVQYNTPGTYQVTLTTTNNAGNVTNTINEYITVLDAFGANNALEFNGVNNYVSIPENLTTNFGTGNFTIETWVSPFNQLIDPIILSDKNWDSGWNSGFALYQEDGKYKFNICDGVTRINGAADIVIGDAIQGTWAHIAVVVDRISGNIKTYLNGVLQNTTSCSSMTGTVNTNSGLCIGADPLGRYFWKGKVDEMRIWNSTRTAQNITDNLSKVLNPQTEVNLVAYYKFDQDNGTILADTKSGLNNGLLSTSMNVSNWIVSGLNGGTTSANSTNSFSDNVVIFSQKQNIYINYNSPKNKNYLIFNILGRQIKTGELQPGSNKIKISETGFVFVKVLDGKKIEVKKLLID